MPMVPWDCAKLGCYVRRQPDPAMFDACFPPRVHMGNIDGLVELDGHFLLVEFKYNGVEPKEGQRRYHDRLLGLTDPERGHCFTVFCVEERDGDVFGWTVRTPDNPAPVEERGDAGALAHLVWSWACRAAPLRMARTGCPTHRGACSPSTLVRAPARLVLPEAPKFVDDAGRTWEQGTLLYVPAEWTYAETIRSNGWLGGRDARPYAEHLDAERRAGRVGATDQEASEALGLAGNSLRPRRIELIKAGYVYDSGARRSHNGHPHIVWAIREGVIV